MNREDIIRMARDNGFDLLGPDSYCRTEYWTAITEEVERFFQAAYASGAAAEREACAKVCEDMRPSEATFDRRFFVACTLNANAIRARGQA